VVKRLTTLEDCLWAAVEALGKLPEKVREKKVFLLWMTDFFRRQLERTASILGIRIPAYM
jgi:hypothetical protein